MKTLGRSLVESVKQQTMDVRASLVTTVWLGSPSDLRARWPWLKGQQDALPVIRTALLGVSP